MNRNRPTGDDAPPAAVGDMAEALAAIANLAEVLSTLADIVNTQRAQLIGGGYTPEEAGTMGINAHHGLLSIVTAGARSS